MRSIGLFILFLWLTSLTASAQVPDNLSKRSKVHFERQYTVEYIESELIKIKHRDSGLIRYLDISERPLSIPGNNNPNCIQIIDLINADTTLYNHKYIRRNMYPISNLVGYPMVVGDFNNNGQLDVAGTYKLDQNIGLADCAIGEFQPDSSLLIWKVFRDSTPVALSQTDVDNDNLLELNLVRQNHIANIEQQHPDSFPDTLRFLHRMWDFSGQVSSETFADLDNDEFQDVLYIGTDSSEQCCHQVFVAEYDTAHQNFRRRFNIIPSPTWVVSGFSVGDFDNDGFTEFVIGSVNGDVYVFENTGNDSYQQIFYDTLSTPNAYIAGTTNDIDGNGYREFFVGGSSFYNGVSASRIYWFEAFADNTYRKVRSFLSIRHRCVRIQRAIYPRH